MKGKIYRWGPVALWMGLIFFLSSQSKLPAIPGLDKIDYSDKIEHAVAYGVLGFLTWRALSITALKWQQIIITIGIAAIYGLSDETHQLFVPGRTFDLLDLGADTLGAAIAVIALTIHMGGDKYGGRTDSNGQEKSQP
ncbi:MAG: VanZ family protein [Armatimonadota bacterium]